MRNVLNNNKGYALAWVLIISILFTVIFFSFLAISSNTTKQNNIVESTFQSQSIAEMGASYFQHAMTNEITTKQATIIEDVLKERDIDIKEKKLKENSYYIDSAITKMTNYLNAAILSLKNENEELLKNENEELLNITIHSSTQNHFEIVEPIEFSTKNNALIIKFTSIGYDELKNAKINGTITADFSNMFEEQSDSPPGTGMDLIADPGTNLTICPIGKHMDLSNKSCQIKSSYFQSEKLTLSNTVLRVDGAFTANNLNNSRLENSTLYITGSMSAGNLNKTDGLKLHVKGALTVGNMVGGNGLSNSIIEVGGSAMMGNLKLLNSTIFIKGDASIGNINDFKNSKVCVNGDLQIGKVPTPSNIYAKTSNNSNVIIGAAEFEAACLGGDSSTIDPDFMAPIEYEFEYQEVEVIIN